MSILACLTLGHWSRAVSCTYKCSASHCCRAFHEILPIQSLQLRTVPPSPWIASQRGSFQSADLVEQQGERGKRQDAQKRKHRCQPLVISQCPGSGCVGVLNLASSRNCRSSRRVPTSRVSAAELAWRIIAKRLISSLDPPWCPEIQHRRFCTGISPTSVYTHK